jgi:RNA polymerase sigma-70 factor (ECF subfamily)
MAEQIRKFEVIDSSTGSRDEEDRIVEHAKLRPEAFGRIYDRYYSVILNYIYHRTFDIALAEELTSNTFFNALRSLGRYRSCGKFAAWLYSIAGNEIRLNWRRRRNQSNCQDRWRNELQRMQFASDRVSPLEKAEEFARIHEALSRLPDRYQTVLALRFFESLSCEEIADVLETKTGTAKSLIHRGIERLKKQYERGNATLSPMLNYPVRKE